MGKILYLPLLIWMKGEGFARTRARLATPEKNNMPTPAQTQASIREILATHGRMANAAALAAGDDLYAAGLTSFSAVQLMLALEETFDVEFPERMLNRRSFASMDAIAGCLAEITGQRIAA